MDVLSPAGRLSSRWAHRVAIPASRRREERPSRSPRDSPQHVEQCQRPRKATSQYAVHYDRASLYLHGERTPAAEEIAAIAVSEGHLLVGGSNLVLMVLRCSSPALTSSTGTSPTWAPRRNCISSSVWGRTPISHVLTGLRARWKGPLMLHRYAAMTHFQSRSECRLCSTC